MGNRVFWRTIQSVSIVDRTIRFTVLAAGAVPLEYHWLLAGAPG
jgi:hypothetical protein